MKKWPNSLSKPHLPSAESAVRCSTTSIYSKNICTMHMKNSSGTYSITPVMFAFKIKNVSFRSKTSTTRKNSTPILKRESMAWMGNLSFTTPIVSFAKRDSMMLMPWEVIWEPPPTWNATCANKTILEWSMSTTKISIKFWNILKRAIIFARLAPAPKSNSTMSMQLKNNWMNTSLNVMATVAEVKIPSPIKINKSTGTELEKILAKNLTLLKNSTNSKIKIILIVLLTLESFIPNKWKTVIVWVWIKSNRNSNNTFTELTSDLMLLILHLCPFSNLWKWTVWQGGKLKSLSEIFMSLDTVSLFLKLFLLKNTTKDSSMITCLKFEEKSGLSLLYLIIMFSPSWSDSSKTQTQQNSSWTDIMPNLCVISSSINFSFSMWRKNLQKFSLCCKIKSKTEFLSYSQTPKLTWKFMRSIWRTQHYTRSISRTCSLFQNRK